MDRLDAISSCWNQVCAAVELQTTGDVSSFLWEMDQRTELHRLLYEDAMAELYKDDISKFHAHLDDCAQCRIHPFDLCSRGYGLLVAAAKVATIGLTAMPKGVVE